MMIQDLFERNIHRPINGVVKADQLDASSIWQELDEFVVTEELSGYFDTLIDVLISSIDSDADAVDKNGIWVAGFFGSGKSHFIKVISYLLENGEHARDGERRNAVDFFADKITDALVFGNLKKVTRASTDTILFNIASKADHQKGRNALQQVFLKVLNEKQGYSGDHPHIARMERHLDEKGQLADFHAAFEKAAGDSWLKERDAWEFHRDEVIIALQEALGQSETSVEKWVDSAEDHFSLTIENFAKWVKRYLDNQGPDHRIMFLVDEVGQFIGNDTHLMLDLQTITEKLGTVCQGRAWVVVTSQEDLDSVLGDLKNPKSLDFSKIQGRFPTRLSLSSRNVDEVIKKRLLDKNEAATAPLAEAYKDKHDILKNQLSFAHAGGTFKTYDGADDFAACYPFAAYQFNLVQKVFESIRKAGATGLHLSQGERSILDAFQGAARQVGKLPIGALVPFYAFYPAVEGFLDTAVKRTIEQADDNVMLESFDIKILQVLFLIRYIDELQGTVDNLVTLCVDEIDADRLVLRRDIEAALARLEKETLIARNGDRYFFLTNEERDIGREIKTVEIPTGKEARELGQLLFMDILNDDQKHTYSLTGNNFPFMRICDDHVVGTRLEGHVEVSVISPMGDRYEEYSDDARCILDTSHAVGRVLIRLPDEGSLNRELRTYLRTEMYVQTKNRGPMPDTTRRILRDRSEDNRARRSRLLEILKTILAGASWFASGQMLNVNKHDPRKALGEALEYVIKNAYPKMGYIKHYFEDPRREIQSILRANNVEQMSLAIATPEANIEALDDVRKYITLCKSHNKQVVLHELIHQRYAGRPYGWPDMEVAVLTARMAVLKEITLLVDKAPLPLDRAYEYLVSPNKQRQVIVLKRDIIDPRLITNAQSLGKDLFAEQGPAAEEALFSFLKDKLSGWHLSLEQYAPLAQTGKYPGLEDIQTGQAVLRKFVKEDDSIRFLQRFVEHKQPLLDFGEDYKDLKGFYTSQQHSWDLLRTAVEALSQNHMQLEAHATAGPALARMEEILQTPRPYKLLQEAADLTHTAQTVNDELVAAARQPAIQEIQHLLNDITARLDQAQAEEPLRASAAGPLKKLYLTASQATSIAHIAQAQQAAVGAYNAALVALEEATKVKGPGLPQPPPKALRVVEARASWSGFIETEEDLEAFVDTLRQKIKAALDAGDRVQIK